MIWHRFYMFDTDIYSKAITEATHTSTRDTTNRILLICSKSRVFAGFVMNKLARVRTMSHLLNVISMPQQTRPRIEWALRLRKQAACLMFGTPHALSCILISTGKDRNDSNHTIWWSDPTCVTCECVCGVFAQTFEWAGGRHELCFMCISFLTVCLSFVICFRIIQIICAALSDLRASGLSCVFIFNVCGGCCLTRCTNIWVQNACLGLEQRKILVRWR